MYFLSPGLPPAPAQRLQTTTLKTVRSEEDGPATLPGVTEILMGTRMDLRVREEEVMVRLVVETLKEVELQVLGDQELGVMEEEEELGLVVLVEEVEGECQDVTTASTVTPATECGRVTV